jgi:hypothetical protein
MEAWSEVMFRRTLLFPADGSARQTRVFFEVSKDTLSCDWNFSSTTAAPAGQPNSRRSSFSHAVAADVPFVRLS